MWWLTLTGCDGSTLHVPLALILRITPVEAPLEASGEIFSPPPGSKSKVIFAGGSIQYLNMEMNDVIKTKAWKWPGVT